MAFKKEKFIAVLIRNADARFRSPKELRRAKAAIRTRVVVAAKRCRRSRNDHGGCAAGSKHGLPSAQIDGVISILHVWPGRIGIKSPLFLRRC
jgi:hypothetical protein